jgi:hypothetical protein
VKKNLNPVRICLNNWNEYIFVNPAYDKTRREFDKFTRLWRIAEKQLRTNCNEISHISDEIVAGIPGATERLFAIVQQNEKLLQSAQDEIDRIFGPKTLRKYFRELYKVNPEFIPNEECINEFIENMKKALDIAYSQNRPRKNQVVEVN